ncbi:unnamed protein product [Adineta steineri]|uniref:ADP ribosyltransferase domain-containing protein n=1 Tax=Adineta steineri TaxID=433720 RepID=A0A815IHK5_9BILA|nr:unnamed protein product [Adineta steineri]CAF1603367.1 unnamed protein product [Adineta steineri]
MSNRKSIATNESDGAINKYPFPEDAEGRRRINIQRMQNVLLIWLDSNIDETNGDCQNTIKQLRRAINDINTFTEGDQCLEFIETIVNKKACMIISGSLGQHIVSRVHIMSQIDSIFIFCYNEKDHEQWIKEWPKIKGVFTDITSICKALKSAAHQCEQNAIPMSFVGLNKKLDHLDPSFMYTQLIKEILLSIKFEQKYIQDYINYCRDVFGDDDEEMVHIKQFEDEYYDEPPIFWYTCDMFLYPMLNRALRLMDGDIITRMGFFIGDLHRNIEQLHQEQYVDKTVADTFTLYRGQGLSNADFEQMMKAKGGLVSFNNFLSTSENIKVSLGFAEDATKNSDQIGILFIMHINPAQSTTPFASIASISAMKREKEVLFSMHSVFRIQDIKQMDGNDRLYQVNLELTADNDPELSRLTDYIREESLPGSEGWYRLGLALYNMGQFNKAEDIYQVLLDQTDDDKHTAPLYLQLGLIKRAQGKYEEALSYFEKVLAIRHQSLPLNHTDLADSYEVVGNVHDNMGNYPTALSSHEKAFEIRQQILPPNHLDLASSYNNISNVHYNMGNYPKALLFQEKALEISKQSLPPNHPDLALMYGNIGTIHSTMAFEIRQQSLPLNHPDLAISYNNIGSMHNSMANYPEALSFHEKALEIQQQSLPSNHPDLATFYANIGEVYDSMDNYPKALLFYEKALEIQQQSHSPNHPSLTISYNNIGNVYYNMGSYPEALSYYEKDLEISKHSLPLNHPDLATSYSNIGSVHDSMGKYPEALSFHEKALEIRQQSLSSNHSDLATSYSNIGSVHYSMGNYPKALLFYEKALEIQQQSLLDNHPDLATTYNNIGSVHKYMGNYPEALSFLEKALEIRQRSLPPNHPCLLASCGNIGVVHDSMADVYSLHYSLDLWGPTDPGVFYPDRHITQQSQSTFLGFGLGPRQCIGMRFAISIIKLTLIRLLKEYTVVHSNKLEENWCLQDKRVITP